MHVPQRSKLSGDFVPDVRVDWLREELDVGLACEDGFEIGERTLQPFSKDLATGMGDDVLVKEAWKG